MEMDKIDETMEFLRQQCDILKKLLAPPIPEKQKLRDGAVGSVWRIGNNNFKWISCLCVNRQSTQLKQLVIDSGSSPLHTDLTVYDLMYEYDSEEKLADSLEEYFKNKGE